MKIIKKDYFVILKSDVGYKLAHKDDLNTTYDELIMNESQIDNYIEIIDETYSCEFNIIQEDEDELSEIKSKYVYTSKIKLKEFLKENPLKFKDKYYTVTIEKQTLFYNQLFSYNILRQNNPNLLFKWHSNDNIDVIWDYDEAVEFMKNMENYTQSLVKQQRDCEEQIKNCKTKEEINNIKEVNYV